MNLWRGRAQTGIGVSHYRSSTQRVSACNRIGAHFRGHRARQLLRKLRRKEFQRLKVIDALFISNNDGVSRAHLGCISPQAIEEMVAVHRRFGDHLGVLRFWENKLLEASHEETLSDLVYRQPTRDDLPIPSCEVLKLE